MDCPAYPPLFGGPGAGEMAGCMRSLFLRPAVHEIAEILGRHPRRGTIAGLGDPKWRDAFSRPLGLPLLAAICERAAREENDPLPVLSDELYADFFVTGVRRRFERVYYERRRVLARAGIRLLAVGSGAPRNVVDSFLKKFEGIFREESWAFPAHGPSPTGKNPRTVDLFAAETANLLAECLDVFGGLIPDALRQEVRERLRRDVFENYLENHASRSMWWTGETNNWNAVCHQGVLGAALLLEEDNDLVARMLHTSAGYLERFLSGFAQDGGCSEGPMYWGYGFGWFSALNEQLETRTDAELTLFAGDERIRRIAGYGPAMSLSGGRLVGFSDCSPNALIDPFLLGYLGRRLGLPSCSAQAWKNYSLGAEKPEMFLEQDRADMFHWTRHFLGLAQLDPLENGREAGDVYLGDLQVCVARAEDRSGRKWEFAAKSGHNDEHHNHNDVGSFILNIDGVPFVTEIGAPEYQRGFFDGKRYSFIAARSLGHSVPVLNGFEQAAGRRYAAVWTNARFLRDEVIFEADLAGAYPAGAGVRSCLRRIRLSRFAGALELSDTAMFREDGTLETAIVTDSSRVRIESGETLTIEKSEIVLEVMLSAGCWERVERHQYPARAGGAGFIHRAVAAAPGLAPVVAMNFRIRENAGVRSGERLALPN